MSRLAVLEGPQCIGAGQTFVVALADPEPKEPRMPLGQWLVENLPRGANLVIPDDEYDGEIPWKG